jgi:hypothetical protein
MYIHLLPILGVISSREPAMPSLDQHPTVRHHRAHPTDTPPASATLDAGCPTTVRGFLQGLPIAFEFTGGEETATGTVMIRNRTVQVRPGLEGTADLTVRADGRSWMRFVGKQRGLLGALLRRQIRLRGDPRLLLAFGRCFPS